MATVTIEVPDDAFAALRWSPKEFAQEMRVAAAVHWYRRELISQGKPLRSRGSLAESSWRLCSGSRSPPAR